MPSYALKNMHLYLHSPEPIFKCRINMPGTISYPVQELIYDGVTLGSFSDVVTDMTLLLGTTDGADDLGRVRVQNLLTSTTIPIGNVSQGIEDGTLNIQDNMYCTILLEFRVWAKIPVETADGDVFKDSNIAVGDNMSAIPPVSNCGPGFANYIDPITSLITVTFTGVNSFAMADGATIAGYEWDEKDGSITVGSNTTMEITATFPAGFRYVVLTVEDSNGRQHTSRTPVLAVDPDADVTIPFKVKSHRIAPSGQQVEFGILNDLSRSTFPDGGLVMYWWDEPEDPEDRSHMKLVGYHQSDNVSIRATAQGNIRETVLQCLDVAGRLDTLPAFPQALERNDEEEYWAYMPTLTLRKAAHYLIHWHSTAAAVADLFLPDELEDYPAMRLDSTGSSLYDQINSRAQSAVPDYWFTCNTKGQLSFRPDWMLLDFNDRPDATGRVITEDEWSDLQVVYTRPPKIYALRSSAVVCSTDWLVLGGEDTLPLAFCIAPGNAFGQGVAESVTGEKLTPSQEVLNHSEGHRYARLNARYGTFNITLPTEDISDYEPASMLPVQLNISATTAAQRGMDATELRGLVKSIDLTYNDTPGGTWVQPRLTFEREIEGAPAVTVIPEVPEDPDYETPDPPPVTVPPEMGLREGVELVAGIGVDGFVYTTSDFQTPSGSGGPTWARVDTTIADTIYSFVVDPFSPGYAPGATSGAINGWIVNDTDIYRVTELFGTPVATSVFTFPVATSGAAFHWRTIQASFGAYFAPGVNPWLLCVSYYGDTSGHTGTWATRSTDGGVTWSAEVQISAFYDTGVPTRFNPIGLFTSPRTPGKAYTAAYGELVDDPTEPLPRWALWHVDPVASGLEVFGLSATFSATALAEEAAPVAGTAEHEFYIILAPPKDAARVVVVGTYDAERDMSGGSSSTSGSLTLSNATSTTRTDDLTYTQPASPVGTSSAGYTIEWTKTGVSDWVVNAESLISSPPVSVSGCRIRLDAVANASGGANHAIYQVAVTWTVTEIELENGHIYVPSSSSGAGHVSTDWGASWVTTALIEPGDELAGNVHIPWLNTSEQVIYYGNSDFSTNREFRLMKSNAGVISDISPDDTGVFFGVNMGNFGVRTYDSSLSHILLAGIGNDVSSDPADDTHAIFYASDADSGSPTWTNVVAPMADTEAPPGRPALQAAFSGDDPLVHFYYGAENYISYTDDAGSSVDSRAGNLSSFGSVYLIGIAGGTP